LRIRLGGMKLTPHIENVGLVQPEHLLSDELVFR
jgi:hypothetical protein